MAVTKIDGLISYKDESGNINEIYPVTKVKNLEDWEASTGEFLKTSNGVIDGPLTLKNSPTEPQHAATKKYVDDTVKDTANSLKPLEFTLFGLNSAEKISAAIQAINEQETPNAVIVDSNSSLVYRITSSGDASAVLTSAEAGWMHTVTLIDGNDDVIKDSLKLSAARRTVPLLALNWTTGTGNVYTQTVSVDGVSAYEQEQEIHVAPSSSSMSAYIEAGVYASDQALGQITFTALQKPETDLNVYVVIRAL